MTSKPEGEMTMKCGETRKRFVELEGRRSKLSDTERAGVQLHLRTCSRCQLEYRLFSLRRAALDAAAAPEVITPDEDFFRALRARIARGPELAPARLADESWTGALLLTARQLIPAMAMLLLLMAVATLFWTQRRTVTDQATLRPRDRVVFSDIYDYPAPTRDDVLETLVAVEEK